MSKLLRHIGISFVLAAGLVGCAAHSPAPVSSLKKDYSSVERGSYRGSYYEVKKGDTLYFIAYVTDKDVNDLVRYNELSQPYTIYPGQKLKLWAPKYVAPKYGQKVEPVVVPVVTTTPPPVVKPTTTTKPMTSSKNSIKSLQQLRLKSHKKSRQRKLNKPKQRSMLVQKITNLLNRSRQQRRYKTTKYRSGCGRQKGE